MTPAKHWGDGKAGSIDIVLDASNLPTGSEYRIKGLDFIVKDWKWTFHADAFDFAKAPEISIIFWPPRPKKDAAGRRKFMCLTDVREMDGNRLLPNGPHEWKYHPGHDNRIKHIRITISQLTPGTATGKNPLSDIRVYAAQ